MNKDDFESLKRGMAQAGVSAATYPAIIERAATGFSVYFPDLPGCTSAGASIEEATANAGDALAGHLALLADAGEPVPGPSPLGATGQDREGSEVARLMVTAAG